MKRTGALALLAALLVGTALPATARGTAPPDPDSYPKLDDKQLGQLTQIARLAHQPDSDWSSMGSAEPGQGGFDAYRYQLAMMSYTLALANYRYTPAYRELDQEIDVRLIHKMLLFDVWGFWEQTSRGSKMFDPSLTALGEGWIDPVKDQNIMYSGHLFQMITTHQMLYGDRRYSEPKAITFVYDPVGRGLGRQEFAYDTAGLAKVLAKQFEENGWKGIECEPNAIFPECNQHPLLGFSLYDRANGTDYFARISKAFKAQFDQLNYIDPATSSFMAMYLVKQKKVIQHPSAWADGWAGSFMHAWYKPEVERIYPIQKSNLLVRLADGTMTTKSTDENRSYSHDHGFFALLASEVGDTDTRDRMLAYADTYWSPRWEDGALVYARQDQFKRAGDGPDVWRRVQPLTGNGLIGLARMDGKDGLYNLFNAPFGPDHFQEPFISGVAFPQVQVARAFFDSRAKALILTLRPGGEAGAQAARFTINNLNRTRSYDLWAAGRRVGEIRQGVPILAVVGTEGLHAVPAAGGVELTAPLASETSFVIVEK